MRWAAVRCSDISVSEGRFERPLYKQVPRNKTSTSESVGAFSPPRGDHQASYFEVVSNWGKRAGDVEGNGRRLNGAGSLPRAAATELSPLSDRQGANGQACTTGSTAVRHASIERRWPLTYDTPPIKSAACSSHFASTT